MVRETGVEPARPLGHQDLNLAWLPFHHSCAADCLRRRVATASGGDPQVPEQPVDVAAGRGGGPDLAFHAELPAAGDWRLFLQFEAAGSLHTAALTLRVG